MCDDNFEADKIRYLYNITKFGSDVSWKGGGVNLKALKKFINPLLLKYFGSPLSFLHYIYPDILTTIQQKIASR